MIQSYAKIPLEQLLFQLHWPGKSTDPIRGAFLLTRPVPKECILDTIDMTYAIQIREAVKPTTPSKLKRKRQ